MFANELQYNVTTLPGAQRVSEACRTCRVVAGSSFPVGEGVSPSSDAGVTGEEAMSPQHHLPQYRSLSTDPRLTFLGVLQLSTTLPGAVSADGGPVASLVSCAIKVPLRLHSAATVPPPAGGVVQARR